MKSKRIPGACHSSTAVRVAMLFSVATACLNLANGCALPVQNAPAPVGTPAILPLSSGADANRVDSSSFPRDPFLHAADSAPVPPTYATNHSNLTQVQRPIVAGPIVTSPQQSLQQANTAFASALDAEAQQSPGCIDLYYFAAEQAYHYISATNSIPAGGADLTRAWQIYTTALPRMLVNGQRYGRFDPQRGLVVNTPRGPGSVGVAYRGFVWQPGDFNRLLPADEDRTRELLLNIRGQGVGVPMVAVRERPQCDGFLDKSVPFSVTAILRPVVVQPMPGSNALPEIASLELIDPLRADTAEFAGRQAPIARDFSAPLVHAQKSNPQESLVSFVGQTSETGDGLYMLEPYQPGKIPLVFIHGLAADWTTWLDLINALRADPLVLNHYQFWVFQYSTAKPFLGSAMNFRQQLSAIVDRYDPERQDPAMQNMLLIGHSMGGLVAKLQVTHSGSMLWSQIASRPFQQVRGDPTTLDDLREAFFFQPVETVRRVVFIATPHNGSSWASRTVGRLASGLLIDPPEVRNEHRQLMQANPGVFSPYLQRRVPTSVDLMEPGNPLLMGMRGLSCSRSVQLHSIIGTGGSQTWQEPSDGVITVASARHPGTASEKFVNARHNDVHRTPESVAEVLRILHAHYQTVSF